jgi:hypothetical protein
VVVDLIHDAEIHESEWRTAHQPDDFIYRRSLVLVPINWIIGGLPYREFESHSLRQLTLRLLVFFASWRTTPGLAPGQKRGMPCHRVRRSAIVISNVRGEGEASTTKLEIYKRYLTAAAEIAFDGRNMPYEWGQLPKTLNIGWMPYRDMFDEFSREIANSVNQLTDYAHRFKVWDRAISSMSDQEKIDAVHEFIDPLATVGLTLPYVIRSRFIFVIAHLCHQANRARDGTSWRDDFPLDRKIDSKHADKYGSKWERYYRLKCRIEKINDESYQAATHDFRHKYNHRFSPHVVAGITQFITRQVDAQTKKVSYSFGGIPPLALEIVAELLSDQCNRCYRAFEAFEELIREHEVSITKHQLSYDAK